MRARLLVSALVVAHGAALARPVRPHSAIPWFITRTSSSGLLTGRTFHRIRIAEDLGRYLEHTVNGKSGGEGRCFRPVLVEVPAQAAGVVGDSRAGVQQVSAERVDAGGAPASVEEYELASGAAGLR